MIETKGFCPLGRECEEIRDGVLYRCNWLVSVKGKDPQSMNTVDEQGCAIAWLPILLVENAQTNRGQTEALNSFRNEVVNGNQQFLGMLSALALEDKS